MRERRAVCREREAVWRERSRLEREELCGLSGALQYYEMLISEHE